MENKLKNGVSAMSFVKKLILIRQLILVNYTKFMKVIEIIHNLKFVICYSDYYGRKLRH